jgi:hypothetical protein
MAYCSTMPIEPLAGVPDVETATVWRFMDFTKYVAMLHRHALYLARADQMPDPFEGSYANANYRDHRRAGNGQAEQLRQRVLLSCWHQNEHESAAMWRIYLSSQDGVAIRTTTERLREAFVESPEQLRLGAVRYLDYQNDRVPQGHELEPFFCKRKSFDYEREVRVLCCADHPIDDRGRYVAVRLEKLIEQVVVSPSAESWFADLVRSVTGKYGFAFDIVPSSMCEPPPAAAR